jgi:tRNA 5-methylaminomethyl-2-thiouridine biosynthesis bifunctional protein
MTDKNNPSSFHGLNHDDLEWRDGTPIAKAYDDIYFSVDNGLEESSYVFLHGIGAPDIWQGRENYTIAETGFGTGLNFLNTWRAWKACKAQGHLTYISVEAMPLDRKALKQSHAAFPEVDIFSEALISNWPPAEAGQHMRHFDDGKVTLILLFGFAETSLAKLHSRIDAWYLDGFAPAKNPDMWNDQTFDNIARLSKPGTRLATFTAAGFVKRGLIAHGFDIQKTPGYGRKRERLIGTFTDAPLPDTLANTSEKSGNEQHHNIAPEAPNTEDSGKNPDQQSTAKHLDRKTLPAWALPAPPKPTGKIAVIGGGIAGAMTAYALKRRGRDVTVFDPAAPHSASRIPAAILAPRIHLAPGPIREFQASAYAYAVSHPVFSKHLSENQTLNYLPYSDKDYHHNQKTFDTFPWGEEWLSFDAGCLSFLKSGTINTASLLTDLLSDIPKVTATIETIQKQEEQWRLTTCNGPEHDFDLVIFATGPKIPVLTKLPDFSYTYSGGQVEILKASSLDIADDIQSYGEHISAPISVDAWGEDIRVLGSSFQKFTDLNEAQTKANPDVKRLLLQNLENQFQIQIGDEDHLASWWGVRTNTPDFLPIIGAVPDWDACNQQYALLKKDALTRGLSAPQYIDGLYMITGFGSKGYQYAPLCAEYLAAQICGDTNPLPYDTWRYLCPYRFNARALIRS